MGMTVGSDRPGDLGTRGVPKSAGFPTEPHSLKRGARGHQGGQVAPRAHCHTNTGRDPPLGHRALEAPSTPLKFEGSLPAKTEPIEGGAGVALRPAAVAAGEFGNYPWGWASSSLGAREPFRGQPPRGQRVRHTQVDV